MLEDVRGINVCTPCNCFHHLSIPVCFSSSVNLQHLGGSRLFSLKRTGKQLEKDESSIKGKKGKQVH